VWRVWTRLLSAAALAFFIAAALSALGIMSGRNSRRAKLASALANRAASIKSVLWAPSEDLASNSALPERRLYPYSVIPGGAENQQELASAVAHDPVVAQHYAEFDVSRAHVIHLDRNLAVYVSYRMGDRVFWTTKRLRIPQGETLITDGVHEARTRCGNRLSETPMTPTSPNQPPVTAMNTPARPVFTADGGWAKPEFAPPLGLPFAPIAGLPFPAALPAPAASMLPIAPPVFPIVGGAGPVPFTPTSPSGPIQAPGTPMVPLPTPVAPIGPLPTVPPTTTTPPTVPPPTTPPPVSTPEPSTLVLLGAGLVILAAGGELFSLRRRHQS
jgi:hypothetical protein